MTDYHRGYRRVLARNAEADDAAVAKQFEIRRVDVHGLRMDLERYGELEVVDS